jgi:hypothetical protein
MTPNEVKERYRQIERERFIAQIKYNKEMAQLQLDCNHVWNGEQCPLCKKWKERNEKETVQEKSEAGNSGSPQESYSKDLPGA